MKRDDSILFDEHKISDHLNAQHYYAHIPSLPSYFNDRVASQKI